MMLSVPLDDPVALAAARRQVQAFLRGEGTAMSVPSEEPAEDYPGPGGHDTAEEVVGPDDEDDFHAADHVWVDTPDDAPPYAAKWEPLPEVPD